MPPRKRTYLDACALINWARGEEPVASCIQTLMDDPERVHVSSIFVKLEVLPKPTCFKKNEELAFYEAYFAEVDHWATASPELFERALEEASRYGIGPMDAVHIEAAASIGADELITAESVNKPMHKTNKVKVIPVSA